MRSLKGIIFDFDGVILETVEIKTEAFRKLFQGFPKHVDEIVQYHKENGGLSRYKKFEYIYGRILKKELTKEESKRLGEQFTQYTYQGILKASFVEGADSFLEKYYKKFEFFVASGAPQDEMRLIVKERGLKKYFKKVFGSPTAKNEILLNIIKEFKLAKNDVISVGDALTDYYAAKEVGIKFVGRYNIKEENPFKKLQPDFLIQNFNELEKILLDNNF